MIKKLICLTAFAASLLPLVGHAQMLEKGNIKAFLVRGDVTLLDNSTGDSKPLTKGDSFNDGTSVITGPESTAVLILSNGSSVVVEPDSELDIDDFQQEAFDPAQGSYLTLTQDPSVSRTALTLDNGTIAGETKKLTNQSEYNIKTPLGSAGIRGTKWGVSVTSEVVNGQTVYTMTVANEEGTVVFETPISTGDVANGDEVVVRGTVNDDGTITIDSTDTSTITNPALVKALQTLKDEVITPNADPVVIETPAGDTEDPNLIVSPSGSEGQGNNP